MKSPVQHTGQILKKNPRLSQLISRASHLSALQEVLHQQLSSAMQEQVLLGDYNQGVLTLLVHDSVWLTRLRYQQKSLLQRLATLQAFRDIQRIQFRISPTIAEPSSPRNNSVRISSTSKAHILGLADSVDDPELRKALQRLARD